MISFAKNEDIAQIRELWDISFPNEDEFTNFFFENVFIAENTIVYKENNEIIAMLQIIYNDSSFGQVGYIYGVCTHPDYRGKGLMSKLLNFTFSYLKDKGHKYTIIVPAEEYLFDIYAKFDFKSSLKVRKSSFISSNVSTVKQQDLTCKDIPRLIEIYDEINKGEFYLVRDFKYYKTQIDLYSSCAKKYIQNNEIIGYSFGFCKDNETFLDEIISINIESCLNSHFGKITYKTVGENSDFAMIKSLVDDTQIGGYINLMLNWGEYEKRTFVHC